jgi:hypothetical protein
LRPKLNPPTEKDRKSQANEQNTSVYALTSKAAPPATAFEPQIDAWQPPAAAYDSMYTQVELAA